MFLLIGQSFELGKANFLFYKEPLLSGPSAKIIRLTVSSVKKFSEILKEISLSGTPNRHPSATSSTIITLKPTAKNTVPTLECCPCDISGISSSTTTYSMAPAAKLSR